MRRNCKYVAVIAAIAAVVACSTGKAGQNHEDLTVEQRLEQMRTDTVWIDYLDSLASVYVGPGAECTDAVKHTFRWDGRFWVYNQDWGGVLEIPEGFVPEDDWWQVELSYHGADIFSPDSLVCMSHFEGFQSVPYEEFKESLTESFQTDSIITWYTQREEMVEFRPGEVYPSLVFETLNADGIKGYSRYVYSSPESVEYSVSLQYPSDQEARYSFIRGMIDRYPFGPMGQRPQLPF